MKTKQMNMTVNYEPEKVNDNVAIVFSVTGRNEGKDVYGRIVKNDDEKGTVSLSTKDNYMVLSVRKMADLTAEELKETIAHVASCVDELLSND